MKDDELSAPMPIPDPKIKVDERLSVEQIGIGVIIYSVGMMISLLFFLGELCTTKRLMRVGMKPREPRKANMEHWHENVGNKREEYIIMSPPKIRHQIVTHK